MTDKLKAQIPGKHEIVTSLDREFARLHQNSCALAAATPAGLLYQAATQPMPRLLTSGPSSVGEKLLRSAAIIEQTFGGITANLWDDPFEWTLPEYLSSADAIIEYLGEVEATRQRAFQSFTDDACLQLKVNVPSGASLTLISLLRDTLRRAAVSQEEAVELLKKLSGITPSGFII
jgi:hypothetical protein